jgi:NitT/TauT family transport system substrate-binding protein
MEVKPKLTVQVTLPYHHILKSPRMNALRLTLVLIAIAALLVAGGTYYFLSRSSVQPEVQRVTIRLKWLHQAQFAGFYVAKEKGFYDQHHLDVRLEPGGVDFPAVQTVASGSDQFGVTGADQILMAREKGVPIVALAVIYRKSPFCYFALQESGIKTPQDFIGKTIGVKLGGNEELTYRAMMKATGVDTSRVTEVPVKFDLSPLFSGQVQAWPGYSINEPIVAEEHGHMVTYIWPSDYGVTLYADTLFTTETLVREQPDVVKGVVEATIEGWNYALEHPAEAVQITLRQSDQLRADHETRMLRASIPLIEPDDRPIGSMDKSKWEEMQRLLLDQGFMKQAVDVETVFTTRFLPR